MSPVINLRVDFVPTIARGPFGPSSCTLNYTGNDLTDAKPIKVLVDRDECLHYSSGTQIYRGTDTETNFPLVLKLCFVKHSIEALDAEARRYHELKGFQGDVIPKCFGYFKGTVETDSPVACLVLEYCGENLPCLFNGLSLERKMQILHKILKFHQHGLTHNDAEEHNILLLNDDFRVIGLEQVKSHECKFAGDFHEGEYCPDVADFGCYLLWVKCLDMKIWDSGLVRIAWTKVSKHEVPSQDIIDRRTPVHGPQFSMETRDKLIEYFKHVKQKLDCGTPLEEIPPFAENEVLICGQLFPADLYPDQATIDRFTPKPINGGMHNSSRAMQLATYFRELKATQEAQGDIFGLTLDWPSRLKGDDWFGEFHQ